MLLYFWTRIWTHENATGEQRENSSGEISPVTGATGAGEPRKGSPSCCYRMPVLLLEKSHRENTAERLHESRVDGYLTPKGTRHENRLTPRPTTTSPPSDQVRGPLLSSDSPRSSGSSGPRNAAWTAQGRSAVGNTSGISSKALPPAPPETSSTRRTCGGRPAMDSMKGYGMTNTPLPTAGGLPSLETLRLIVRSRHPVRCRSTPPRPPPLGHHTRECGERLTRGTANPAIG